MILPRSSSRVKVEIHGLRGTSEQAGFIVRQERLELTSWMVQSNVDVHMQGS